MGQRPPILPEPHMTSADEQSRPARRHYRDRQGCGTYVRLLTNCRKYQLRVWCPLPFGTDPQRGFPVHCGLFNTAKDARAVLCKLTRLFGATYTPLGVWKGVAKLQDEGIIPIGRAGRILPLWVRRCGDGRYTASATVRGTTLSVPPQDTPEAAHTALWSIVATGVIPPSGAQRKQRTDNVFVRD